MSRQGKKVLLTGYPGCGKTTIISKISRKLETKARGFFTEEVRGSDGKRIGFDVVSLDNKRGMLARSQSASESSFRVGSYYVYPTEFESIILPVFKDWKDNIDDIFILDEIGKMEMFSKPFIKIVEQLFLSKEANIIATIPVKKGKPIPLIEKLRDDPGNMVIIVNTTNRNGLPDDILKDFM